MWPRCPSSLVHLRGFFAGAPDAAARSVETLPVASVTPCLPSVSVVIPTYRREQVLLNTVQHVVNLRGPLAEVIVVDQTQEHEPATRSELARMAADGSIRWIRLHGPSITHAMNVGLRVASGDVVLFLDDDIVPDESLIGMHAAAIAEGHRIVAGRVLQPWDDDAATGDGGRFRFSSDRRQFIGELMAGNFSVTRALALELGGFDENFVHVAYRFEADFAARAIAAGQRILFEPRACIRHLKASAGGTRSYGHHLTTVRPSHAVGDYYYLLHAPALQRRWLAVLTRPLRAVRTRHHLRRPWWIPGTVIAELTGLAWAAALSLKGRRLLSCDVDGGAIGASVNRPTGRTLE
ncbi:MAG TPA: glycosyltransferase family 2 protein [Vicinamibacterales bacterium]|nr:glycosyltransferase family 2 protein [Vicinamibacterales bacterium]